MARTVISFESIMLHQNERSRLSLDCIQCNMIVTIAICVSLLHIAIIHICTDQSSKRKVYRAESIPTNRSKGEHTLQLDVCMV